MYHVRVWRAIVREGSLKTVDDLLKFAKSSQELFGSRSLAETFLYFCFHKEATAKEIQNQLKIPEATTYRVLKKLETMDLIKSSGKASPKRRGGPKSDLWRLKE